MGLQNELGSQANEASAGVRKATDFRISVDHEHGVAPVHLQLPLRGLNDHIPVRS